MKKLFANKSKKLNWFIPSNNITKKFKISVFITCYDFVEEEIFIYNIIK